MYPKLSVICLTYNHAKFIRQALDGFVMQKTNFSFEVIIHDDASTDGTADIIREYETKYPDIIKPIYQTENQWGKKNIWREIVFPLVKGEYVLYCEGDDYFTEENKLQKQVDYLDAHPECSICFHPVAVKWEDKSKPDSIFPTNRVIHNKTVFTFNDLIQGNFMQTNSVMYRWRFHKDSLDLIKDVLPGDWYLHLLHAQVGKIGFLPDVMAVYRKHSGGIWYGAGKEAEWYLNMFVPQINFYEAAKKQFNVKLYNIFYNTIYSTYYAAVFLNRHDIEVNLRNKYSFLTKPAENLSILKREMLKNKIIGKLLPKPWCIKYKANHKALKLYLSWINK